MTVLFHYTCDHGHTKIGAQGVLVPGIDLMHPSVKGTDLLDMARFVWLTDLARPIKDALGLTSNHLTCDRTAHRYRVTAHGIAIRWVDLRRDFAPAVREMLESAPYARPMHWWVAAEPVPVTYDPVEAPSTA